MRTATILAVLAFIYLAEESIISDYNRYGKVSNVHVDKEMLQQMSDAIENIDIDDLKTNSITTVVTAVEDVSNAAAKPVINYSRDIIDLSNQMATVANNQ